MFLVLVCKADKTMEIIPRQSQVTLPWHLFKILHEGPNLHVRVFSVDMWFCQMMSILDEDSSYGKYVAAKHLSSRIFRITPFTYFLKLREKMDLSSF